MNQAPSPPPLSLRVASAEQTMMLALQAIHPQAV